MPPRRNVLGSRGVAQPTKMILHMVRISATIGPAERQTGILMDCPICRDLKRAYEAGLSEYIEARSSAYFQLSKRLAAQKNVEMERARYELEEHQLRCVSALRLSCTLA